VKHGTTETKAGILRNAHGGPKHRAAERYLFPNNLLFKSSGTPASSGYREKTKARFQKKKKKTEGPNNHQTPVANTMTQP
jgi:hypothetical protein